MRKQKLLFIALTLSIITTGSIAMPHIIKAERTKTSLVDLRAESISLNKVESNNVLNQTDNTDSYGSVVCYSGDDVATHQICNQEEVIEMVQSYNDGEIEMPFVYEYRGYRAGFVCTTDKKPSEIPEVSDVEPETIVKKSIDTLLDVDGIDLANKAIVISLNRDVLGIDGYSAKRYYVEVFDANSILEKEAHGLYYYGYLSLSGETDAFFHTDTFESSDISENTSDLKYWPNTGEAAEDIYGQTFGKAESDEDYKTAEKYIQIINDKLKDYGIPQMKEVRLGYIKESILYLFADMEDGKFDEIDYSLKYDEIIRYKKRTEPEFTEFFLMTKLPEDLQYKAYIKMWNEQNEQQ